MFVLRVVLVILIAAVVSEVSVAGPALEGRPGSRVKGRAGPRFCVHRLDAGSSEGVVRLGKVFRPGEFDDREECLEFRVGSKTILPQLKVFLRHDDQSVRLARFTLPLRLGGGTSKILSSRFVSKPVAAEPSAFRVVPTADGLEIGDGLLGFRVRPDAGLILEELSYRSTSRPWIANIRLGLGRGESTIEIEDEGPYALVLVERGLLAAASDEVEQPFVRRISVEAGQGRLSIETWIEGQGPVLPQAAFVHGLCLARRPSRILVGHEVEDLDCLDSGIDIDRFGRAFESELVEEMAASGFVLQAQGSSLRLEIEDLVDRGPGRVQLEDRLLTWTLSSDQYRWRAGRSASRRIDLVFRNGGRSRPATYPRLAVEELLASARPEKVFAPALKILEASLGAALEDEARRKTGFDWRGEINWGDWRWSRTDAGNLEYDTILGLRHAARMLDRPALLARSRQALKHFLRVDLNASGIPWRHGPGHVGGVEAGHMWLEGAIEEAVSDADAFLIEGLLRVVEAWKLGLKRLRPEGELCRSLAWTLILGTALAEDLAEPDLALDLARVYRAVGEAPGADALLFDRFKKEEDGELRYYASTWVTLGLLGEALHRGIEAGGKQGALARWRRAAETMTRSLWPEESEFPAARFIHDESGAFLRQGGRLEGEEALFLCLGLGRSKERDGRQEELMVRLLNYAVQNLRLDEKTFNGIELSQILWCLARLAGSP